MGPTTRPLFDCRRQKFYLYLLADKGSFEVGADQITHRCSTALKANMTAVVLQNSTQPLVRFFYRRLQPSRVE